MKLKTTREAREDARRHITKGGTTLATKWLLNLLNDFATLQEELNSARKVILACHTVYGSMAAYAWLKSHPEPKGKHVADPEAEAEQAKEAMLEDR